MLDTDPPAAFQVGGNFGRPAGIAEALLQSLENVARHCAPSGNTTWNNSTASSGTTMQAAYVGDPSKIPLIRLLPALPLQWASNGGGSVTGLLARGGFEVDVYWDSNARLVNSTITSSMGGQVGGTLGSTPIGGSNATNITVVGQGSGGFVLLRTNKEQNYSYPFLTAIFIV